MSGVLRQFPLRLYSTGRPYCAHFPRRAPPSAGLRAARGAVGEVAADLDVLVPAWFACRRLGVTKQTFGYWRTSGKVKQATDEAGRPKVDGRGSPLYRYGDVVAAERATRRSPNSRRGVAQYRPAAA